MSATWAVTITAIDAAGRTLTCRRGEGAEQTLPLGMTVLDRNLGVLAGVTPFAAQIIVGREWPAGWRWPWTEQVSTVQHLGTSDPKARAVLDARPGRPS